MDEEKKGDGCLQHGSHPGGAECLLFDHLLGFIQRDDQVHQL